MSEDGDIYPLTDDTLFSWPVSRLEYMSKLRQDVLESARMSRAEFLFVSFKTISFSLTIYGFFVFSFFNTILIFSLLIVTIS